jgi:hypothetical protein
MLLIVLERRRNSESQKKEEKEKAQKKRKTYASFPYRHLKQIAWMVILEPSRWSKKRRIAINVPWDFGNCAKVNLWTSLSRRWDLPIKFCTLDVWSKKEKIFMHDLPALVNILKNDRRFHEVTKDEENILDSEGRDESFDINGLR